MYFLVNSDMKFVDEHYIDVLVCVLQHSEIPCSLEATDELLERTAGTDINNVYGLFSIIFHYKKRFKPLLFLFYSQLQLCAFFVYK